MASQIQDEGFHEIQLNGKQLVFLFMAATVVSVVIFLCGVLVGRGVRAERGSVPDTASINPATETTPQQPPTAQTPTPAGSDPTVAVAPPPPTAEDLSYFNRLEKPKGAATEDLKAKAEPPAPKALDAPKAPEAPKPSPKAPQAPVNGAGAEPGGAGYAVQIAALNVRSDAEAIAKRLSSKGYAAYVVPPATGTPSVYRVRVGKYPTRREAESIAAKLQKEEQFKPWVTK